MFSFPESNYKATLLQDSIFCYLSRKFPGEKTGCAEENSTQMREAFQLFTTSNYCIYMR